MLSPADAAVVSADPDLPGLALLLDPDALQAWLRATTGWPLEVDRRYLRYKAGTSCVLGLELRGPDGAVSASVTAHAPGSAAKMAKTLEQAPEGSVLAVDEQLLLLVATGGADRDLPGLAALDRPERRRRLLRTVLPDVGGLRDAQLTTLSHKPQRRWVGLLRPSKGPEVVLRVYRPDDAAAAASAIAELAAGSPWTPRVLGTDLELGVVAVEHLPGRVLDARLGRSDALDGLRRAGVALAELHGRALCHLPEHRTAEAVEAVEQAARAVGLLLPHRADDAAALAGRLAAGLHALDDERLPVHGDFSADQVVLGHDGRTGLIDLDDAALGHPAVDLCGGAAALAALDADDGRESAQRRALLEGYAQVRPLPDPQSMAVHGAAMLLRRAVQPFRELDPQWPGRTGRLLDRALREDARTCA